MRSFLTKVLVIIMAVNAVGVAKDLTPLFSETNSSSSTGQAVSDRMVASTSGATHQDCKNDGGDVCSQCHLGHCAFVLPAPTSGWVSLQVTTVDSSTESTFVNRSIAPPSKPPKFA